ncbi:hypothetical protein ACFLUM_01515 [Chloroflexota bacterium]
MRRFLFAVLIVAMLAVPSTALAADPEPDYVLQLGDLMTFNWVGFTPLERVDAFVTRAPTAAFDPVTGECDYSVGTGWPLETGGVPIPPLTGSGWKRECRSEQRKLTRELVDPVTGDKLGSAVEYANAFGRFNEIMMLPRDEVFYPCSFPLKWKCNYEVGLGVWEYHSPVQMNYDPVLVLAGEDYWPWLDDSVFADPRDTISPLWVDVLNFDPLNPLTGHWDVECNGMAWKWSDK